MSDKSAWPRRLSAVVGWTGVTAVAALGSWLGMSSVLTATPAAVSAATVVSSSSPKPTRTPDATDPQTRDAPSSSPEPDEADEESTPSPRPEWNGWTEVDDAWERYFDTDGGTAVIRLEPTEATLVSASPAENFMATKKWPSSQRLVVTFVGPDAVVIVDASWRDGRPYAEVTEV